MRTLGVFLGQQSACASVTDLLIQKENTAFLAYLIVDLTVSSSPQDMHLELRHKRKMTTVKAQTPI